jgi:signal transduction histidine kinase
VVHATFRAMRRIRGVLLDVLVALPFLVVGQLTAWGVVADGGTGFQGSHPVNAALAVLFDGLVVLRRRAPLVALALMLPVGIAQTTYVEASAFFSGFVPVVLLVCSAAMRAPRRWSLAATLWALGGLIAIIAIAPDLTMTNELPFSGPIVVLAWALGRYLRARDQRAHRAEAQAATLAAASTRVLEEERARIARELHDVIAHSVSVMVVQAGAARTLLTDDTEAARAALFAVERSGRQALEEMRRLLGMLRRDQREAELLPQPSLDAAHILIDQVRATGLPVALDIEGSPQPLSPGVDLSAYRILQEALTNTVKHANASSASVRLRFSPTAVEVEVEDNGRGRSPNVNGGHGLIGMRERVELYGGEIETGPREGGGFRVRARLPLEAE